MVGEYWFTSDRFEIDPSEDEQTNPGCYGKAFASWLSEQMNALGYHSQVIGEDWGWCVLCYAGEYSLWLGCGAMIDEPDSTLRSKGNEVVWHVFSVVEIPPFQFKSHLKKWLGKLDLDTPKAQLDRALNDILMACDDIRLCDEP